MKQLTVEEQQLLCDLLAKLPNIDLLSERHSLVIYLPPDVRHSIPRSENTRTDLANIVSIIGSEAYFELVDHSYPVITVIQTAQNKVKKTFLYEELQRFIESLRDRCNTFSDGGQQEYCTNTKHYLGKYDIKNDSPIQGQVIGEHVYVTMHFGDSQEEHEPPFQSSNNRSYSDSEGSSSESDSEKGSHANETPIGIESNKSSDHSQVSHHPFSAISTQEDTVSTCSSLNIFQQKLHTFLKDVEYLQIEIISISAAFANTITQMQCRTANTRIKNMCCPIDAFTLTLQNTDSLRVIAHRTGLMKEMLAFDKQVKLVQEDIWQFSKHYGATSDQPANKRQEIRNQLAALKQHCVSMSKAASKLQDLLAGPIDDKSTSTSS